MNERELTDAEIASFYHSGLDWINSYIGEADDPELQHEGKKERSGRYAWGSGARPFQRLGGLAKEGFKRLGSKKETSSNASKEKASDNSDNTVTEEEVNEYHEKHKHLFAFDREKKPSEMSDEELDETIRELETQLNRLNKEKKVSDLTAAIKNYGKPAATPKQKKDAGIMKSGLKALMDMNGRAINNIGTQLMTYGWGTFVNKLANDNIVNPKKGQKDK